MTARRTLKVLALGTLLVAAVACNRVQTAGSREPVTIRVTTGSATGNFRPFGEALAKGYKELMPDIRIESIGTPGSVHNLESLQDGAVDIGLAQAGIAYMAYNGRLSESKRPLRNIRGIAVLNSSEVHLLVGPASTIRSIEQLRGHRVGLGPKGEGLSTTAQMVLRGYFSPGDVKEVHAGMQRTMKMLLDNSLDAAFTMTSVPNEEARVLTGSGARLLPLRGPAIDRLRTMYPFFRSRIIPAGQYRGQLQPVHTLSVDVVLLTRADIDDAVVRRLTEGLFRMLPKLGAELPFLQGMVPERAPATPVPLHPGAALYYRERELRR